jgi:hypothetical protein
MKHEESKAPAHMAGQDYDIETIEKQLNNIEEATRALLAETNPIPTDYDHDHTCQKCGKPVNIRVKHPLSVVLVLQHWHDKLDGKCKSCIAEGEAKA